MSFVYYPRYTKKLDFLEAGARERTSNKLNQHVSTSGIRTGVNAALFLHELGSLCLRRGNISNNSINCLKSLVLLCLFEA